MLDRVSRWLSSQRAPRSVVLVAVVIVPFVAWVDYRIDPEIQLDLFYVLPAVAVAWAASRRTAVLFALYAAAAATVVAILQTDRVAATMNGLTHLVLFLAVALLIGSLRDLLDEQRELAGVDPLTHLLNRRAFDEALTRELQRETRDRTAGTLLHFDIDGLKQINDEKGHAAGDIAISRVAGVTRECARRTDLLARMGGDEFAAYLPETSVDEARLFAERLVTRLEDASSELSVSVSIGMVSHRAGHSDAKALLERADAAMYRAKQQGGGRLQGHGVPPE